MVNFREDWGHRESAVASDQNVFSDIFLCYLKKLPGKTCLKIGCVPGSLLGYICKNFGYYAEGIGNAKSAKRTAEQTLRNYGINECTTYEEDFLK